MIVLISGLQAFRAPIQGLIMTVDEDLSPDIASVARGFYDSGNFARVLALLPAAGISDVDPRVLGYAANANLKLGRPAAAADCFVAMADRVSTERWFALKSAATLYLRVADTGKLAGIAAAAIRANPTDPACAFSVLRAVHAMLPLETVEPLLDYLNHRNGEHVHFIIHFYRERKKDFARAYSEIIKGVEKCPDDGFLLILRYSWARVACDFPLLRAFDHLMALPRSPVAEKIFLNETALDRLYWSDNEEAQTAPVAHAQRFVRNGHYSRRRREVGDASRPLRIGYISNDFGHEVVMTVFRPVLERHDPGSVEIRLFCYSSPEVREFQRNWSEKLRAAIVPIADLTDQQAAEVIAAAEIDILVDLKGHTRGERLPIMRLTDAPVTATYLGYPGSAFAGIDYVITDPVVTPDTSKPFYDEKLCRLPEVQMPNGPLTDNPCRFSRGELGLPENSFVFASFNGQQKITPRTLDLWVRILAQTPASVLWLACSEMLAAENLRAEFSRLGIDPQRIIFNTKISFPDHIGRLALADLVLDTLPYNGHSTTADMLRGGLPVLTVKGNSYHSRVSWSLLKSCGIEELAAENDEDYCRVAAELARNPARLGEIRHRLRNNRAASPLFDPDRMARHLERAYQMMAERARAGLAPDHFDVPPLER
jgi:predicted O-linked N-acetylglucosamine transferase (SPINDLY family)